MRLTRLWYCVSEETLLLVHYDTEDCPFPEFPAAPDEGWANPQREEPWREVFHHLKNQPSRNIMILLYNFKKQFSPKNKSLSEN